MALSIQILLDSMFVLFFWGISVWTFFCRNNCAKLNKAINYIKNPQKRRLSHPFKSRKEVMWISNLCFLIGLIFLILLITALS